ncbi:MAG: DUF1566 domain-containing protein [Paraburkholderia sp.]|uniref:DUF1566 domain-containing protein n=1 Tax=Paraburkholderia sp. TaxID=1926495 RepID=UPI003C550B7A
MTITLYAIKAEQTRVSEMIAAFEKQQKERATLYFPEVTIDLKPGEEYAGMIVSNGGESSWHVILLPGDLDKGSWSEAMNWASKQGGGLPNRREQSLLFANLKESFEKAWYWSAETHESDSAYAWYQYFGYGYQTYYRKGDSYCRARAVRRLVIE